VAPLALVAVLGALDWISALVVAGAVVLFPVFGALVGRAGRELAGRRWALQGDWLALPLRDSSCDVVIGDGVAICLRYPDGLRALARSLRRVLKSDGVIALRSYVQLAAPERPEDVIAGLDENPSFHHFKLRLAMAMQPAAAEGVAVNDVYNYWAGCGFDKDRLMCRTGWPRETIETIELYRGVDTVHTFPTLAELRLVLREYFSESAIFTPSYFLGERCPTLVLQR